MSRTLFLAPSSPCASRANQRPGILRKRTTTAELTVSGAASGGAKKEERRNRGCSQNPDQGVKENSTQPDAPQTGSVSQVAASLLQGPCGPGWRFFGKQLHDARASVQLCHLSRCAAVSYLPCKIGRFVPRPSAWRVTSGDFSWARSRRQSSQRGSARKLAACWPAERKGQ